MNDPNRRLLDSAADLLRPLLNELVFVGGLRHWSVELFLSAWLRKGLARSPFVSC
jgi:hypothetical protein